MAVGQRPKLTMPILACIIFLHKNDPNLFCILNSKWSKKLSAHIWPVGSCAFDQNGMPHGALITWDGNFFHKRYPLWILILYRKMFSNLKIGPVWAGWPTPPFVQNGPHCSVGPQIHELANFFIKQTPFQFWFCVIKSWKIFKSVHSGPIGRPPIFQNSPQNGASNTWVGNFWHKTDPL